mgnify:FL=1
MIDEAKKIGVDCVKFQTYSTDNFCADKDKTFTYFSQGVEISECEYDMFKRLEFNKNQWVEIIEHCSNSDMPFVTTVQDPKDLKMLLDIGGLKAIKVGSDDFDHPINLKIYAKTGIPLIISKGMTTLGEVDEVVNELAKYTSQLAVLHCVSLYPSNPEQLNIRQVLTLKELYPDIVWGFSDHSQGALASTIAASIGANIVEKHFTLDHNFPGPDHWFSMDLDEMKELVSNIRISEKALGDGKVVPIGEEMRNKSIMRRRVVAKKNIKSGTIVNIENVTFKRSNSGCFISDWNTLKGNKLKVDKVENQGIHLSDVNFE